MASEDSLNLPKIGTTSSGSVSAAPTVSSGRLQWESGNGDFPPESSAPRWSARGALTLFRAGVRASPQGVAGDLQAVDVLHLADGRALLLGRRGERADPGYRPDSRAARIRLPRGGVGPASRSAARPGGRLLAGNEAADALPLIGPALLRTLSPCQPPACVASPFSCSRVRSRSMSESPRRCSQRARACRTRCGCAARHLVW